MTAIHDPVAGRVYSPQVGGVWWYHDMAFCTTSHLVMELAMSYWTTATSSTKTGRWEGRRPASF